MITVNAKQRERQKEGGTYLKNKWNSVKNKKETEPHRYSSDGYLIPHNATNVL